MAYRRRLIDRELEQALGVFGAVVLEGPKWCGKTASALQIAKSVVRLDVDFNARQVAMANPAQILNGPRPRLFDEWQLAPELWNHMRHVIDHEGGLGSFLLTGSAAAAPESGKHSGAGRFHFLRMRPMSLFETGVSNGSVSLHGLGDAPLNGSPTSRLSLQNLFEIICTGGWPEIQGLPPEQAIKRVRSYVKALTHRDLVEVAQGRNPVLARKILKSLARNVASEARFATLARDAAAGGDPIKDETVAGYLAIYERMMVTEELEPWSVKMRSSARVRKSAKRFFTDPSIAAALLLATPEKLLGDFETAGLLFENLVIRDLRIFAQHHDAEIFHYRDSNNLEVDAIVQRFDGSWGAIEIKMSDNERQLDSAAIQLTKFRDQIDLDHNEPPEFLAIITNTEYSYTRADGIHVISITALGA